MNDFPAHFFHSSGVKIHYRSAGSGPLMVFLHGFPEFWYQWRNQLHEFSKTHFVVAPDLRGFNLSDKPNALKDYHIEKVTNDLKALCDHLGYGEMILIGHDWGGIIAWAFAHYHPNYLKKLILLNAPHPAIFEREIRENPLQQKASAYILFLQSPEAELKISHNEYQWLCDIVLTRGLKKGRLTESDKQAYLHAWSEDNAVKGMLSYYRNASLTITHGIPQWATFKLFPDVNTEKMLTTCPTLLIWGERDNALRIENLDGLEKFATNLTIKKIPHATHWLVQEQGTLINQMIQEYISQ